jgi:hypothetical protein
MATTCCTTYMWLVVQEETAEDMAFLDHKTFKRTLRKEPPQLLAQLCDPGGQKLGAFMEQRAGPGETKTRVTNTQ